VGRGLGVGELKRAGKRASDLDQRQVAFRIGGGDAFDLDAAAVFVVEGEGGRAFDDVIIGDNQATAGDEKAGALSDRLSLGVVGDNADDAGSRRLSMVSGV